MSHAWMSLWSRLKNVSIFFHKTHEVQWKRLALLTIFHHKNWIQMVTEGHILKDSLNDHVYVAWVGLSSSRLNSCSYLWNHSSVDPLSIALFQDNISSVDHKLVQRELVLELDIEASKKPYVEYSQTDHVDHHSLRLWVTLEYFQRHCNLLNSISA